MEFQRERVYTALNADELRAGDKVIAACAISTLKRQIETDSKYIKVREIYRIADDKTDHRFRFKDGGQPSAPFAYLVERKENCTNCHYAYLKDEGIECALNDEPKPTLLYEDAKLNRCRAWGKRAKPKTDTPELISLGNGQYVERKHYRPFRDTDELIKVWGEKIKAFCDEIPPIVMPLIWVQDKESGARLLITIYKKSWFSTETKCGSMEAIFNWYTFLDGSPCGVEE